MTVTTSRRLLFVLGMHRSGTSALCAALSSCGVSFGESLLTPMSGVNDEGFWEDQELVSINERVLRVLGVDWYSLSFTEIAKVDWSEERWSALREEAVAFLSGGFGGGLFDALKDPRLCITLPFWLELCDELDILTCVCATSRAPLGVAKSLQKRDGFPLGFGLRLYAAYRKMIAENAPPDAVYVSYDELIRNASGVMSRISEVFALAANYEELQNVVKPELRHQVIEGGVSLLEVPDSGELDMSALDGQIEQEYPIEETLNEMAEVLVHRGQELSAKGIEFEQSLQELSSEHISALATLDERDIQIHEMDQRLDDAGRHLAEALKTIPERDSQIEALDTRLQALGDEHSYALGIINERDEQLAKMEEKRDRIFAIPVIGRVFSKLWFHETS